MTRVQQVVNAIVEYTRGHTGLLCEEDAFYLTASASSDEVFFRVDYKPERVSNRRQAASLFMDTISVSIFGTLMMPKEPEMEGRIPIDRAPFDQLPMREINATCSASLYFQYTGMQGGSNGTSRIFTFKNSHISTIS